MSDPSTKQEILASGLRDVLFECGTLVALTGIFYLLAPGPDEETFAPAAALDPDVTKG